MNDLKDLLFEETLFQQKKLTHIIKTYGEFDYMALVQKTRVDTLLDLIIDSNLEYEYQDFKATKAIKD